MSKELLDMISAKDDLIRKLQEKNEKMIFANMVLFSDQMRLKEQVTQMAKKLEMYTGSARG